MSTDEKLIAEARTLAAEHRSNEHRKPIDPKANYRTRAMRLFEESANALDGLASRLEQALSTGPAHDAGLIEAMARVEAFLVLTSPPYSIRLSHGYDPTFTRSFEAAERAFHADLRLILQALVGHDRHRFGSPPEPVVNPNEAWCDAYAAWYYQEPA